jgi:hypothetical protein
VGGTTPLLRSLLGGLYTRRVTGAGTAGLAAPPAEDALADATQVLVSYCSGDVHWGDAVGIDPVGEPLLQRGAANVRAVLAWLDDQAATPEHLSVVGCSAGAYGALLWASALGARFPSATRSLLLDGGLGVVQEPFLREGVGLASWNVADAFAENGVGHLLEGIEIDYFERLVAAVAATFDGPIGVASTDRDVVQAAFWYLMGEDRDGFRIVADVDAWATLAAERLERLAEIDGVSTFVSAWVPSSAPAVTAGTTGHCLSGDDDLWRDGVGEAFRAWWGVLLSGRLPESADVRE